MLKTTLALLLSSALLITGCTTTSNSDIYYWGEYEQLIYDAYINPGSADVATQLEKLTADIQKSEASGKKVPPGIYAHLGFLYAIEGKEARSKAAFQQEQALYPESRIFIEGMLNRAKASNGNTQ